MAHVEPEKVVWAREIYERYPPDPTDELGLYKVLRTGEPEFYPDIPDELLVQGARDEGHLRILQKIGFRSCIIVPLILRNQIAGVLSFVNTAASRAYNSADLALAENLAGRASLAIDNAKLFQSERQIRRTAERTSDFLRRLQSVSASLSQALTPQEVTTAVVEQAVNSLGAHAGTVVLLSADGSELEIVGAVGFAPEVIEKWKRFSLDINVSTARAVKKKKPVIIEFIGDFSREYPAMGPLASIDGSHALAAFPLIVEGRIIGAMSLSFPQALSFDEDDSAFMQALAQQCSQAVERARLYLNEQHLRAQAEAANLMKDVRVLVVDDEPDAVLLLKTIVESCGGSAATAHSASEALCLLKEFDPHVMVSDIGMPVEDGYSLIRKIRVLEKNAESGNIPAIALTAYTRKEDKSRILDAGFHLHISKPIDTEDFVRSLVNTIKNKPKEF